MKINNPNQRYTYFFRYRGQGENEKAKYVTTAYSLTQAVKQLVKRYPNANIYNYFDNNGFDITRKDYIPKPKEEPKKKNTYQQMSFKGFTDQNSWPNL